MSKKVSVFVLASAGGQRKRRRTPFSFARLVMSAVVLFAVSGCATTMTKAEQQVWRSSFSRDANGKLVRFIPPELWSGASWNGDRNLNRLPVFDHSAVRSSRAPTMHYSGPLHVSPEKYPTCTKPIYKSDNVGPGELKSNITRSMLMPVGRKGGSAVAGIIAMGVSETCRSFQSFLSGIGEKGRNTKTSVSSTSEPLRIPA